jgi:hypothetical protein
MNMDLGFITILVGFPILALFSFAGYVYVDASNYGMDPKKWAAISFLIPFFGFFAYLFERDERTPHPDRDMFTDGLFEIHESRADETLLEPGGPPQNTTNGGEDDTHKSEREGRDVPVDDRDRRDGHKGPR